LTPMPLGNPWMVSPEIARSIVNRSNCTAVIRDVQKVPGQAGDSQGPESTKTAICPEKERLA
jgi:hypothetical protein